MSNRFHNKWHRRNHHTYGNNSNPDAGHDPIASPQQPFLGDFSLSGSLSAVAPLSAFAAYLYTNNTGLCSYAGRVGAFIHSYGYMGANIQSSVYGVSAYAPFVGIAANSPFIALSAYGGYTAIRATSPNRGLSAYGGGVAGEFGSPLIALSANGGLIGAQIYSPRTALSAYGSRIGTEIYSDNLCLSGYSPLTGLRVEAGLVGGQFRSRVISLSTGGGGINIFNSRTGIYKEPRDYYGSPQQQAGQIVLDVGGDVWIDGACTIMGDLSAYGTISYLDTKVTVTSSLLVNNKGTDAAATFIQTGAQPILRCFDQDIDLPLSTPSFIVDGATNGWVGIGVATPTAPFNIVKNNTTNQLGNSNQPHFRISDGTTNRIILGTYGTNNGGSNPGGTTNPYIGTENSAPFDILTNNDSRITIQSNGNVGINDVNGLNTKFSIYANDASSNFTALSAWGSTFGAIIAGGETRINNDGGGNTNINSANTNTATVNIGTTGAASSNVNVKGNTTINTNCATNTTNIGTGTTTGKITIGNTGLTGGVEIDGAPIDINASAGTYTTNIGTGTTSGAVNIATGTGNVSIGNATGSLTVNGNAGTITTASTLGITTGGAVTVNTTTGRAFDLNSGTNATTNINTGGTNSTATNIHTGGNTGALGLGNATGNTNIAGNAIGITSAGTVSLNTTTARTTNLNTGTGAVTTTIGSAGTVAINGTTNITGTTTIAGNTTIADTAGNTLTMGNQTGAVDLEGSTLGITTANTVSLNTTTARTTNLNTGTGAVTTTIGNAGTVAINGTTNITGTTTLAGNITIADTAGNTLTIGNQTGAVGFEASTLDIVTGSTVNLNTTTGRALNINTGTGGVTTTIGNNSASNSTVINSQSITAPNQIVNTDSSILTRLAGDTRYGQQIRVFRTTDLNRISTITLADDDVLIIPAASLLANRTYLIECVVLFTSTVTTNGARIAFNDASAGITNVSISDIFGAVGAASVTGYISMAAASNTTTVATGTTPITFTRKGTFRTGASPGNIALQWAQGTSIATNTTIRAGSYLSVTLLG
jgi:hypothetical protein